MIVGRTEPRATDTAGTTRIAGLDLIALSALDATLANVGKALSLGTPLENTVRNRKIVTSRNMAKHKMVFNDAVTFEMCPKVHEESADKNVREAQKLTKIY